MLYRAVKSDTCPKAGPKGGDGEAFPAGMYIRTVATNFPSFFPLAAMAYLQIKRIQTAVGCARESVGRSLQWM